MISDHIRAKNSSLIRIKAVFRNKPNKLQLRPSQSAVPGNISQVLLLNIFIRLFMCTVDRLSQSNVKQIISRCIDSNLYFMPLLAISRRRHYISGCPSVRPCVKSLLAGHLINR